MRQSFFRKRICLFFQKITAKTGGEINKGDLPRSALIFSPHFDDETLGCGGTIIKKKRAGADIKIIFMTDGSKSHSYLMSEKELKAVRVNEAVKASQELGLDTDDMIFLSIKERKLNAHSAYATEKVGEILQDRNFKDIFIPYSKEPLLWSEDHLATRRIVLSALQSVKKKVAIYEYPIWFWWHWPWARRPADSILKMIKETRRSLVSSFRLFKDLRLYVDIEDVLEQKRASLNRYTSQMTRLIPDPRWKTLSDTAHGEFLAVFFQKYEVFHRYYIQ